MLKNKLINAGINLPDEQIRRLEIALSIINMYSGYYPIDEFIGLLLKKPHQEKCGCPKIGDKVYHVVGC